MDTLQTGALNICTSVSGLTAGTTTTFTIANDTTYSIKGKAYKSTAASNATGPTSSTLDPNTGLVYPAVPLGSGAVFVFCFDGTSATAATALKIVQGPSMALNNETDTGSTCTFSKAPQFPTVPDTLSAFGYLIVKVGTGGTAFQLGTSNLATVTKVGKTFVDVLTLPPRPVVS